jgi:formamidopyrimidine-DNA glycosylase
MPELPEVETVMRGIEPAMTGYKIDQLILNRPDLRWPFPGGMAERVSGTKVLGLRRRSKYILADLDSNETLLIHLGMSGRILVSGDPLGNFVHDHPPIEKHDHVIFSMENGARITFNDPRRFGAMDLLDTNLGDAHPFLRNIGPEPFGNEFHENYLVNILKKKNSPIKSVLLDQRIVAGLGNIYVCEVLFRAGISPKKLASTISAKRTAPMVAIIRDVLGEAIQAGGSTLKDFRHSDGELGYFQHTFKVYGREGEACTNTDCGAKIKRIVQSGRSSFYCPKCQR